MPTPPLSGRPLLDTDADAALFVPLSTSSTDLAAATERGYSVLLHGPRGSGRTTLLRALLRQRRSSSAGPTVHVQAAGVREPAGFLAQCRAALTGAHDDPTTETTALSFADELRSLAAVLPQPPQRALFLVDNLDPHLIHRVFGTGRDDLWELDASFVVTATDDDLPIVLSPPADAFFDVRIAVPPPRPHEAAEILRRRLGRDVSIPASATTPRALLDAARADPTDPASADATTRRRLDRAAALGGSALDVAHLLDELGTVGASDETARVRLGLTAARISQILVRMYDEGLVTYEDVRTGGPGRPQRRYRWSPDIDLADATLGGDQAAIAAESESNDSTDDGRGRV